MFETRKSLDHLDGTAALLLVQRRNVNAGDHLVFVRLCVVDQEDLAVTLAKVERDYEVRVVLGVGRGASAAHLQHLLVVIRV